VPDFAITEFLGIPLYDSDLIKLCFRFALNFFCLTIVVRFIYYQNSGSKDYLFTFFMINVLVFLICFTLKKFELQLGMALGLFAIFGILRYRTDTIPIKEMTYLFIVIGLGVINALANKKMSYAELAFANVMIIGLSAVMENLTFLKREMSERVLYEKINLVKPSRHAELVADLEERTGLVISRIELGQINFLQDTVLLDVYYFPHLQQQVEGSQVSVSRKT